MDPARLNNIRDRVNAAVASLLDSGSAGGASNLSNSLRSFSTPSSRRGKGCNRRGKGRHPNSFTVKVSLVDFDATAVNPNVIARKRQLGGTANEGSVSKKIKFESSATPDEMDTVIRTNFPQLGGTDFQLLRCSRKNLTLIPLPQDVNCPAQLKACREFNRSALYVRPTEKLESLPQENLSVISDESTLDCLMALDSENVAAVTAPVASRSNDTLSHNSPSSVSAASFARATSSTSDVPSSRACSSRSSSSVNISLTPRSAISHIITSSAVGSNSAVDVANSGVQLIYSSSSSTTTSLASCRSSVPVLTADTSSMGESNSPCSNIVASSGSGGVRNRSQSSATSSSALPVNGQHTSPGLINSPSVDSLTSPAPVTTTTSHDMLESSPNGRNGSTANIPSSQRTTSTSSVSVVVTATARRLDSITRASNFWAPLASDRIGSSPVSSVSASSSTASAGRNSSHATLSSPMVVSNSTASVTRPLCSCGRSQDLCPVSGLCLVCRQDREYEDSLLTDRQRDAVRNQRVDVSPAPQRGQHVNDSSSPVSSAHTNSDTAGLSLSELRTRRLAALDAPDRQQQAATVVDVVNGHWIEDVSQLQQNIDVEVVTRSNTFNVDRFDVFSSFKRVIRRNGFSIMQKIDVCFVDVDGATEGAIDGGGPTREFLRLLLKEVIAGPLFEGPEDSRYLKLNTNGIQSKEYTAAGTAFSLSLLHGGPPPLCFSTTLFKMITGQVITPDMLSISEVSDAAVVEALDKISQASTTTEVRAAISAYADTLNLLGCFRPLTTVDDKTELIQQAVWAYLIGRVQVPLAQFKEGLSAGGLLEKVCKNPTSWLDAFTGLRKQKLTSAVVNDLFTHKLSPEGSNRRTLERRVLSYWKDWLIDLEDGQFYPVTLEKLLVFCTGADSVPPLGFPLTPSIEFNTDCSLRYPTANTCALVLRLPVSSKYEEFTLFMGEGILQSPSFGQH